MLALFSGELGPPEIVSAGTTALSPRWLPRLGFRSTVLRLSRGLVGPGDPPLVLLKQHRLARFNQFRYAGGASCLPTRHNAFEPIGCSSKANGELLIPLRNDMRGQHAADGSDHRFPC